MTQAPNETLEQYNRKNELFKLRDARQLTLNELIELRELAANSMSHLTISTVK